MPAYSTITWVLRWLSWLTPVAYAFEGMMINQFDGTSFFGLVIVDKDGTSNIGNVDGTKYLSSQSLPRSQWGNNTQVKIFNCLMLFVFAMALDIIAAYYQESSRDWYFNNIRRSRATVARSKEEKELSGDAKLDENGDTEAQVKSGEGSMGPESLAVTNLSYTVNIGKLNTCCKPRRATCGSLLGPTLAKIAGKSLESPEAAAEEEEEMPVTELKLLNEITARFKCGRMTALMGQSGAGKTTLLVRVS